MDDPLRPHSRDQRQGLASTLLESLAYAIFWTGVNLSFGVFLFVRFSYPDWGVRGAIAAAVVLFVTLFGISAGIERWADRPPKRGNK